MTTSPPTQRTHLPLAHLPHHPLLLLEHQGVVTGPPMTATSMEAPWTRSCPLR